jgi:cbb3-type cytochrome oxidase subunit 3
MKKAKQWGLVALFLLLVGFAFWFILQEKKSDEPTETTDELDRTEEMENKRIRSFFDELNSHYGYVHLAEEQDFQLLLKFSEAYYEGEIAGSILLMENTGEERKKTSYDWAGITDGNMIKIYLTEDGEQKMVEGKFHGDASSFELSFWLTDQPITFHAATKEEYRQHYEAYTE